MCLQIGGYPTLKLFFNGEEQETYRGRSSCHVSNGNLNVYSVLGWVRLRKGKGAAVCAKSECIACFAGGRDLSSMKQFIDNQKVTLLKETEA